MRAEIEHLWARHLAIEFPEIGGDEVPGIDLILLDADIAGHITAFLDNGGRLAPARKAELHALSHTADRAAQSVSGAARDHFARLSLVAGLVVRAAGPVAPQP